MDEELENLKPSGRPAEMERWNVEDLKSYRARLADEIARIDAALEGKQSVRSAAEDLFKKS